MYSNFLDIQKSKIFKQMKKYISIIILFTAFACNQPDATIVQDSIELTNDKKIIEKGKELTALTFSKLSTVLKSKMKQGGVHEAISYCNISAFSLVDSISKANNVTIKRVSLKYRNPSNQPDSLETVVIKNYQNAIENKLEVKPMVYSDGSSDLYFAPILTKGMCLSCHGTPGKHISDADYAFIKEKYPNDKAINYKAEELRGIWSIRF